jgi:hypothetical protein
VCVCFVFLSITMASFIGYLRPVIIAEVFLFFRIPFS